LNVNLRVLFFENLHFLVLGTMICQAFVDSLEKSKFTYHVESLHTYRWDEYLADFYATFLSIVNSVVLS